MSLQPGVRVYILVRTPESRGNFSFQRMEIENISSVDTTLVKDGINTASVSVSNSKDKRWVKQPRKDFQVVSAITELKELLTTGVASYISPTRDSYRTTSPELLVNQVWVLPFEKMTRIWIDYKGRDGLWYAGFSGVITTVSDTFMSGSDPTIILSCMGMKRFWDVTMIIGNKAISPLDTTFQEAFQTGQSALSFSYAEYKYADLVIREILNVINTVFVPTSVTQALFPPDICFRTSFWNLPNVGSPKNGPMDRSYIGLNNLRPKKELQVLDRFGKEQKLSEQDFSLEYESKASFYSDKAIDSLPGSGISAFQRLLKGSFELFQSEKIAASEIIRRCISTTFFDIFEDAIGNIIYQMPKYDRLPYSNVEPYEDLLLYQGGFVKLDPLERSYNNPLQYHGKQYVIGNEGLISWNFASNESVIKTLVSVTSGIDYSPITDSVLMLMSQTGYAPASEDQIVRYGIRHQALQAPFLKVLDPKILSLYGYRCMAILNSLSETGSVIMNQRPDLQLGRTVYVPERNMMYYISSIQQKYVEGKRHTTTIQLTYGHRPEEPIGNPFEKLDELDYKQWLSYQFSKLTATHPMFKLQPSTTANLLNLFSARDIVR